MNSSYSPSASFRGEFSWLSNFYLFEKAMIYDEMTFHTAEHFYVAMKTKDKDIRNVVANHPSKGLKRFGQSLLVRSDWEDIKLNVMLYALRYKFSTNNPKLRQLLLSTGYSLLEETNYWGDRYWGICKGAGENNLGKLIMKVRDEIRT